MPDEGAWRSFFDADCILGKLEVASMPGACLAEFGCGYGTFTLPAARRTSGTVYTFDIESDLVALVQRKAREAGLTNLHAVVRDFVTEGTGLSAQAVDHVMIYNLLHIEDPVRLLREAFRILRPGRALSIIHWKYDPDTPRGPPMNIRPRPEQCRAWAEAAGFEFVREQDLSECCRYHYGLVIRRPA